MAKPAAMAIGAHPDDIELMMTGTLLLLGQAGYDLHIMNVANGCCGSAMEGAEAVAAQRLEEARAAAEAAGATLHEPVTNDIEVFYTMPLLAKVGAAVRKANPRILLVQSPQDYMEDHMNACRLAVSAAFTRTMVNFRTDPPVAPVQGQVTVYHALPWGLRDPLRKKVMAGQYVDIAPVMEQKKRALACHASQKEWLDQQQGFDSYIKAMEDMAGEVGQMSGAFEFAEGWRRHHHLGFCAEHDDPLTEALGGRAVISREYEAELG